MALQEVKNKKTGAPAPVFTSLYSFPSINRLNNLVLYF